MIPAHFAVKFLNLGMTSFITLQGLSSPKTNTNKETMSEYTATPRIEWNVW